MISLRLAAESSALADTNPYPAEFASGQWPLAHQVETAKALKDGAQLVVQAHTTGAGKTRAALLHLYELAGRVQPSCNALLIAPTNELIAQHAADARRFVERNGLPYSVRQVTAPDLRADAAAPGTPAHLERPVEQLRAALDPATPTLVVTNPDLFYYALFFAYHRQAQRDLFRKMLANFGYVIVDEFHYYHPKQLVCFLFFMSLSKTWGYFDEGRQMALLSATPGSEVRRYLERLDLRMKIIAPGDDGTATTTTLLAPLDLTLVDGSERQGLASLVAEQQGEIARRLHAGEQGAGISSALWRVNEAYACLRAAGLGARVGRITGAEGRDARSRAASADFILATPTVDIGYNFARQEKQRQSIDFALVDARSSDELVQRLGRAGRVLGKAETTRASAGWATAPPELLEALAPYDGTTIDRGLFRQRVSDAMPPRFTIDAACYIDRQALVEVCRPLVQLGRMLPRDDRDALNELFEGLRAVLAPRSHVSFPSLRRRTWRYLVDEARLGPLSVEPPRTARAARELKPWREVIERHIREESRGLQAEDRAKIRRRIETTPGGWNAFLTWLEKQRERYEVDRARFRFRDSFDPPLALIADPEHHLTSELVVRYDALHVVQNYEAVWFDRHAGWWSAVGHLAGSAPFSGAEQRDDLFCVIRRRLPGGERRRLRFTLQASLEREAWEARYCLRETSVRCLEIAAEGGPLPPEIVGAFRKRYVPLFIAGRDTLIWGKLIGLSCIEGWVPRDLEVRFPDGGAHGYVVVAGTAMFFAYGRLRGSIYAQQQHDGEHQTGIII